MIADMDVPELLDRVREAETSEKNARNRRMWGGAGEDGEKTAGQGQLPGAGDPPPITVEPEAPLWTDVFEFSLADFYTNPEVYLRRALQIMLYKFSRWDENTVVERTVDLWMGVSLEPSLFGMETVYRDKACPWISEKPVIDQPADLAELSKPDFETAGIMPTVISMYEELRQLLPDDFSVTFPRWERSPFGVCNYLRGTENVMMDLVKDPEFVRKMVDFVTDSRKKWTRERAQYLGTEVQPGVLLNDEVNGNMFRPQLYEKLILPHEVELGDFQGIWYWHSCGNVTDFLKSIRKISGLRMFHVSPWTNLERAAEVMNDKVLQICFDPLKDVQRASEDHIRDHLNHIINTCQGRAFTLRVDGIHNVDNVERELAAVDRWVEIALDMRQKFERKRS